MVVLGDARLFDPHAGAVVEHTSIRLEGDRVVEVGPEVRAGTDVPRIDLGGAVVLPGLIDAHVHVTLASMDLHELERTPRSLLVLRAARELSATLARGFTTVRDAGGADRGLADGVAQGLVRGPRLFVAGRVLTQTGGHGDFRIDAGDDPCACGIVSTAFAHVADGVDQVRRAARTELRRGAHQLKLMASGGVASPADPLASLQYSTEELAAIADEATSWGTYAMAHAYTPGAISRAVQAGVRTIEHGNLLDDATAAQMAAAGAFLVPTLITYQAISEVGAALGFPAPGLAKLGEVLDEGLHAVARARAAGVRIGFGTDLLGDTRHRQSEELLLRSEVEDPVDILRSATIVNAEILGRSGELGVVAPGALADLLVLDADPLTDLGVLTRPEAHLRAVVQGGEVVVGHLG